MSTYNVQSANNVATVLWVLCSVASGAVAQESDCYGPGSIAGSVIGTLVVVAIILGLVYLVYKHLWKPRREKHLVLETDPETGDKYAFDNPCFKDASGGLTPIAKALDKSGSRLLETGGGGGKKWSQWSPLGALVSTKNEKKRTLDDTCIENSEVKVVSLRSHDFTGLGFNICGNMRDGIYIKDVLHRGPASESGKLNPGDRINSVRISFEHMVYEDALTILSYASPYEVQIEARGGLKGPTGSVGGGQGAEPRHPLYRSSSSSDLVKIGKSARQRLFMQGENLDTSLTTDYATLQLSSNNTTLERSQVAPHHEVNTLTKPERTRKTQPSSKNLSPEQLKSQLEHNLAQKIAHPPEIYAAEKRPHSDSRTDAEKQTSETDQSKTRFQKFGVRVLPMENKVDGVQPARSPKSAELSQNDNNINLERHVAKTMTIDEGVDEVDKTKLHVEKSEAPPVKRREKNRNGDVAKETVTENVKVTEGFQRENSLNGSGIKRDKAGIPQEIPDHMLQAAVAARKNRKSTEVVDKPAAESEDVDLMKTPKKTKGKAPAPPPDSGKADPKMDSEKAASEMVINKNVTRLNFTDNFDEISTLEEKPKPGKISDTITNNFDDTAVEIKLENGISDKAADELKEYCSDSDVETDNQSSVNTIELNSSDITIHHSEEDGEIKGRKTASTGDLSKIQKGRKSNTGTLERAQSLDITDSGIPTLTKKRKATKDDLESKLSSDESLYEKTAIKTKEPRLSLALDGLNTFQRNRLKKSSEWGNLEDVIMNLDKVENDTATGEEEKQLDFVEAKNPIKFDFGAKDANFGNVISSTNDIRVTLVDNKSTDTENIDRVDGRSYGVISHMEGQVKNVLWPNMERNTMDVVQQETEHAHTSKPQIVDKKDKVITEKMQEVSNIKVHNVIWPMANTAKAHESETNQQLEAHISSTPQTKPVTPEKPTISQTTTENKTIIHSSPPEPRPHTLRHPPSLPPEPISNAIQTTAELITTSAILNPKTDTTDSPPKPEIVAEKPSPPQKPNTTEASFSLKQQFQDKLNSKLNHKSEITTLPPQPPTSKISSTSAKVGTTFTVKPQTETSVYHPGKSSQNFIFAEKYASTNDTDNNYAFSSKLYDTNVSDDIKVSRHSLGSLERPKSDVLKSVNKLKMQNMVSSDQGGVSNVVITESKPNGVQILNNSFDLSKRTENQMDTSMNYDMSSASELYMTAIDSTLRDEKPENDAVHIVDSSSSPSGIKNITISETVMDSKYITDSPSSLTIDTSSDGPDSIKSNTLTFVTEIQVSTPSNTTNGSQTNISEIEITTQPPSMDDKKPEETLKKLPEMKFTTSSYEPPKTPEKRMSQIELLRSNFEKSPPKPGKPVLDISPSKSRIPVATKLDMKFSPERKEFQIGELDIEEKEIVDIMASSVHSTPLVTSQRFTNKTPVRNVTVTSIRTSSKIPSGSVKPPVPARPSEHVEVHETRTVASNGGTESSFKQWVFNPSETSVTNIVVNNNKEPHK